MPHAHFIHCPGFETDFLREVGLDQIQRRSRSEAMEIVHVYLNGLIQLVRTKLRCVASVETLLFKTFCHVYPACSSASRPHSCFRSHSKEVEFPMRAVPTIQLVGQRNTLRSRPRKYELIRL